MIRRLGDKLSSPELTRLCAAGAVRASSSMAEMKALSWHRTAFITMHNG